MVCFRYPSCKTVPLGKDRTDGSCLQPAVQCHVSHAVTTKYYKTPADPLSPTLGPGHTETAFLSHPDEDRHQGGVPVVGNKDDLLSRPKGQKSNSLDRRLVEEAEPLVVVQVIGSRLRTVQLGACLAPHLCLVSRVREQGGFTSDVSSSDTSLGGLSMCRARFAHVGSVVWAKSLASDDRGALNSMMQGDCAKTKGKLLASLGTQPAS